MTKADRARQLRYKRAALEEMGYEQMMSELYDIEEACNDVRWFINQENDDTLLNALDGNEEEEYEFRMAFADVEGDVNRLREAVNDMPYGVDEYFDDCTVALIGNRYETVGYDGYEEDYYHLSSYEQKLAHTEAGKRIMRMTKAEMISTIGQCMGIVLAFWNLRQRYDYLKTTFDILRNENMTLLKHIKEIEAAYEKANTAGFEYRWSRKSRLSRGYWKICLISFGWSKAGLPTNWQSGEDVMRWWVGDDPAQITFDDLEMNNEINP